MRPYEDGHSTTLVFQNLSDLPIFEKEVTPPGMTAGGPIDTTTMRNTTWRTMAGRALKTLTPVSATVAFAFEGLVQIGEQVAVNQIITVSFPDGSSVMFWGWIEECTPNAFTEGEQPTAQLTIQPSNHNNDEEEVAPTFNDTLVTLWLEVEPTEDLMFRSQSNTFRVRIENLSSFVTAENVSFTITLPDSFTFIEADQPMIQEGDVLSGVLDPIAAGDEVVIVITVSPNDVGTFPVSAVITSTSPIRENASLLAHEHDFVVFDLASCSVTTLDSPDLIAVGGDKFDCYPVGDIVGNVVQGTPAMALLAGTGFGANWIVSNPAFEVVGDTFESYDDQAPITDSLNGGTGMAGAWRFDT